MAFFSRFFTSFFGFSFAALGIAPAAEAGDLTLAVPNASVVEIVDKMDSGSCLYGSLGGGVSFNRKLDYAAISNALKPVNSGFIEVGLGCSILDLARIEGEFGYRFTSTLRDKNNVFDGKLKSFTGFANIWFEPLDFGAGAKPYLGGGIGFASHKLKTGFPIGSSAGKWSTSFAWQVGAGVRFALVEKFDADIGYRFKNLGSPYRSGFDDLYAHELRFGLSVRFDGLL